MERAREQGGREKSADERAIEARWADRLTGAASQAEFQQAYDELHALLLREGGDASEIYSELRPQRQRRIQRIIAQTIPAGARVLEIGGADGSTSLMLARQGADVLSVDVSALAVERARRRAAGEPGLRLAYREGDCRALDEPDASMDYVVSENVAEHLSAADWRRHLAEARRVLRPEGAYLLFTPSRLWNGRRSVGLHLNVYTLCEMAGALRESGFRVAWLPPRLAARRPRPVRAGRAAQTFAFAYERLLMALRVYCWPVPLRSRVIPQLLFEARKPSV